MISQEEFKQTFAHEFLENAKKITVYGGDNREHLAEQGLLAMDDFYLNWQHKFKPVLVEHNFMIDRGEDKLPIKSFADLITKDCVYDWKFGASSKADNYLLNMTTYALGFKQLYGFLPKVAMVMQKWTKKKIDGKYKFFFNEFEEKVIPVKEDWIDYYLDLYDTVEQGINANVFPPVKDGDFGLCKECYYRKSGKCEVKTFYYA